MNFRPLIFGLMAMDKKREYRFNKFEDIDLCGYRCNRQK